MESHSSVGLPGWLETAGPRSSPEIVKVHLAQSDQFGLGAELRGLKNKSKKNATAYCLFRPQVSVHKSSIRCRGNRSFIVTAFAIKTQPYLLRGFLSQPLGHLVGVLALSLECSPCASSSLC